MGLDYFSSLRTLTLASVPPVMIRLLPRREP